MDAPCHHPLALGSYMKPPIKRKSRGGQPVAGAAKKKRATLEPTDAAELARDRLRGLRSWRDALLNGVADAEAAIVTAERACAAAGAAEDTKFNIAGFKIDRARAPGITDEDVLKVTHAARLLLPPRELECADVSTAAAVRELVASSSGPIIDSMRHVLEGLDRLAAGEPKEETHRSHAFASIVASVPPRFIDDDAWNDLFVVARTHDLSNFQDADECDTPPRGFENVLWFNYLRTCIYTDPARRARAEDAARAHAVHVIRGFDRTASTGGSPPHHPDGGQAVRVEDPAFVGFLQQNWDALFTLRPKDGGSTGGHAHVSTVMLNVAGLSGAHERAPESSKGRQNKGSKKVAEVYRKVFPGDPDIGGWAALRKNSDAGKSIHTTFLYVRRTPAGFEFYS